MDIKWKKAVTLILMFVMVCGLTACGNAKRQTDAGTKNEELHEPLTINRFNIYITEEFVNALHEVYPEINLQIVSYAGKNGSGYAQCSMEMDDMTDIHVTTQPFHKELMSERFTDLSNYDFVNNYSTFLLNSLDVDGGIYLLPSGYMVAGMYYNKTIMQENGWQVPDSFEELMELVPQIEAAGYQPFANAIDLDGFPFNYFFSLGNTIYFGTQDGVKWKESFPKGEAAAAGNEGLENVVQYYNEWVENGVITGEHMSANEYMESGNVVFYLCLGLTSYEYEAEDGSTYEFGIMPWLSRDGSNNMLTRNVPRYFGINKHLEEEGNEQKLEDALHVMEFISTEAGQNAIMASTNSYISPLSDGKMADDNPFQEVADVIDSGHSVQMVYVGWEDLIVPIAQDIRGLISGEIPAEKLTEEFDTTYDEVSNLGSDTLYGTLTETLSYEKTAELCAIAEGKAVDADCAMVSLNEYHGDDNYNLKGVGWHLWADIITTEQITMICPGVTGTISVLELTGAEIKEMQKAGFDANQNGNPYDYVLVTRGDAELEDDTVYRLAIATNELPETVQEKAEAIEITPETAIQNYVKELGTFGASDIVWEG
ncbi:ABC transporter substrate-binding protein [Ruminococcus sp. 5_1_39BFAA]|uniref:ABC transporter substrate-binding protein n=1 Tax=Ruminococcus sp. 5_1_39BFAA TaxID=457412 RepID=UPI0035640F57